MPKRKRPVKANKEGGICIFCSQSDNDEIRLGKIMRLKNITVHYFCMLFSSKLVQRGKEDDDGILGFLPKDILREQHRGTNFRCNYCRETGATLGCAVPSCKKVYHLPCGVKNYSLQQYFDTFRSFCADHRPRQNLQNEQFASPCPICKESVDETSNWDVLRAPCCQNALFHRPCVQQQALNAGVFYFKCSLCNNKERFQEEMLTYGIYIPEQDASWELEANAYQELLHRHNRCDHPNCKCPDGPNYNRDGTRWEVILCSTCGSEGVHVDCGNLHWCNPNWECSECSVIGKEEDSDTNSNQQPDFSPKHSPRRARRSNSRRKPRKSKKKSPTKKENRYGEEKPVLREVNINWDNNDDIDVITIDDDEDNRVIKDENAKFERVDSNFSSDDKRVPRFIFDASSSNATSTGTTVKKSESFTIPKNFSPELIEIDDSESESIVTSEVDPSNFCTYSPKPQVATDRAFKSTNTLVESHKSIAANNDIYAPGEFGNWSSEERFSYSGSPYVEVNMVPVPLTYDSS